MIQAEVTPRVKDLQTKLLEKNNNWKIPERRVKKFLKRHLNKHSDPSGADDDASMMSVRSFSPGKKVFKKMFGRKSKSKSKSQETAPVLFAPITLPEPAPAKEEPKVEEPETEPAVGQSRSLEQVYSDDNDGKKNDCHCGDNCVIS